MEWGKVVDRVVGLGPSAAKCFAEIAGGNPSAACLGLAIGVATESIEFVREKIRTKREYADRKEIFKFECKEDDENYNRICKVLIRTCEEYFNGKATIEKVGDKVILTCYRRNDFDDFLI
ncbi:hypothetical protein [Archaeoglobus profundus]|uniref:Uncharacterized protein n=1 Tax=Archaeoglobus profundus (strain DSM 5631 / JCM 9629 / NBRC 100127 / Av18) TaxID=572546 RepID=D2RHX8_ARCPA|nr:hypothetical protein [Archaeoglobus profundus]ADB57903.1 hypothetical protein Arcpr_0840 [Archaeoglobus profundus DSM 5631]